MDLYLLLSRTKTEVAEFQNLSVDVGGRSCDKFSATLSVNGSEQYFLVHSSPIEIATLSLLFN